MEKKCKELMKIFLNGKKMKYFIHQRPWFLLLLMFPQQEIHIFSRLFLFASLFLKCKTLKIKGVSIIISLTEDKYFSVIGILTSQDGPKAIFVIPTPYIYCVYIQQFHTFSHKHIV